MCSSAVDWPSGARSWAARLRFPSSWTTTSIRSPPTCDFSWSLVPRAMILPLSTTAIAFASSSASSRYCVVRRSVAALADLRPDHVPHPEPAARIEPGRRLVEEQEARPADQRAGEIEPPPHPARVRLRDPVGGLVEEEALEQLVGTASRLGVRELVEAAEHPEVLASGQVLVDGRVLAGEADRAANRLRVADDVEPRHARGSRVRAQQRGEDPHRRRLAGAVRAEQAEHGSLLHLEVDPVERAHLVLARAVDLHEPLGFDRCHAARLRDARILARDERSAPAPRRPLPREHRRGAVGERPGAAGARRRRAARRLRALQAPSRGGRRRSTSPAASPGGRRGSGRRSRACSRAPTSSTSSSG